MTDATRRCADCDADISHRTRTTQRCTACRDVRRRSGRRGGLLQPRTCEGCGQSYQPTGSLQRWCKSCVWDDASRWRMNHHGDDVHQYRRDLASGSRTSACEVCGDEFTYRFVGGAGRTRCDRHPVADQPPLAMPTRSKCSSCGLASNVLDERGECHRHRQRGARVERKCEGCDATFDVPMKSVRRFCTSACGNANRRPMNKARACTLCQTAYFPRHPQQKYCKGCAGTKALRHRASRYGISGADLKRLQDRFNGLCWICRTKSGTCVDHDHGTGATRGWLCMGCNAALAYVERPEWWRDALAYLILTGSRVAADDRSPIPLGVGSPAV